jgi:hypothetical protein
VIKLKIKYLLLIFPFLFLLTSCDKRQDKAEALVRDYLQEHLPNFNTYKSQGFSKIVKLKDKTFPGAKAPVRAFGRWEIEHKYSFTTGNGASVTETKFFEIDSTFTHASCCYVQMSDTR